MIRNINWRDKILDLIIVIIGISVAFQLNNWNDAVNKSETADQYIANFGEENSTNIDELSAALEQSSATYVHIDSLQKILDRNDLSDDRIPGLMASIMMMSEFRAHTSTMENIIASGDFHVIENGELRKQLVATYGSYKVTAKLEMLTSDYVNSYLVPFLFDHLRLRDLTLMELSESSKIKFENIIIGYQVLLNQQISGYETARARQKLLGDMLRD